MLTRCWLLCVSNSNGTPPVAVAMCSMHVLEDLGGEGNFQYVLLTRWHMQLLYMQCVHITA